MSGILARSSATLILAQVLLLVPAGTGAAANVADDAVELDRHRLWGRALYENDRYEEAAAEFRRCLELAPDSATDHFNLALVVMRSRVYEEPLAALDAAERLEPELLAVPYIRGIIHKRLGAYEAAIASLQRVAAEDPDCFGAWYNLGICYKGLRQPEEAARCFETSLQIEPENPSPHYQLMGLFRQMRDMDKVTFHRGRFEELRDTVDESEKTVDALERSRYSYIIDPPRLQEDLPARPGEVGRFTDVTAASGLDGPRGGAVALLDYDRDGDRDLYLTAAADAPFTSRLYRNDGNGTFEDVTAEAGVAGERAARDVAVGDYDNDGFVDLYVAGIGPNVLYRNRGDGTFEEVSAAAGVDEPRSARAAVFVDYDHDDDLDLYVGNGADGELEDASGSRTRDAVEEPPRTRDALLRNHRDGTFGDVLEAAGLGPSLDRTRQVLVADLDGDQDTDLLLVYDLAPPRLFLNARMARFVPGGIFMPPLPATTSAVAEGDFDHDGDPDLIVAGEADLSLYTNHGNGEFSGRAVSRLEDAATVARIEVLDANGDGWADLLGVSSSGNLLLWAAAGPGAFEDVSSAAGLGGSFGRVTDAASGDVDGDGDADVVLQTADRGPVLLANDAPASHWLEVSLVGEKVNKSGLGSTVEIAAAGHYQRQTYRVPDARFGLGSLQRVDVVRVTWTNGVTQNVLDPPLDAKLVIEEEVKVSASCGFLYAYDGRGFELVNEILGIGPLGVPMAPGRYHQPDSTELTRIESRQLAARDGFYELRLTEELRETMYADAISLRVVDHPTGLELVPNEMFTAPPFPEDRFFAVGDHRPPHAAVDDSGEDVRDLVLERDGRFPTFALTAYEGIAEPHALVLDLGGSERQDDPEHASDAGTVTLFLDAWIYWPESSTVMAVAQDPRVAIHPLALEVPDGRGGWRTAIESVGLPTSKGLVVPVDLTGLLPAHDPRVRLSTTLCVYFDRIFVSTHDQAAACRVTELPVHDANLRYRGFSAMRRDRYGFERFDYTNVSPTGSWSPPLGLLTRYGDVTPLLDAPDDRYVILGPGDELALRFDAGDLPPLPDGWARGFIFYANGWVKDGDLNTRFSQTVTPLPFHGMSGYPYPDSESYPETPELRRYQEAYNTRPSLPTVGRLPGRRGDPAVGRSR